MRLIRCLLYTGFCILLTGLVSPRPVPAPPSTRTDKDSRNSRPTPAPNCTEAFRNSTKC